MMKMYHPLPADLIVKKGVLVPMNADCTLIFDGAVAIQGDTILDVGTTEKIIEKYTASQIIDASHQLILPGFINGHTHAAMSLLRGIADDVSLRTWLKQVILPVEHIMLNEDFVYWGTLLAGLEMIRSGITTAVDMYYHENSAARAYADLGMRAITGSTIAAHPDDLEHAYEHIKRWQNHPLITPAVAPHSLASAPASILTEAALLARAHKTPVLMHLAETNYDREYVQQQYHCDLLTFLEQKNLLNEHLIIAHGVHLASEEIKLIANKKVGVIHCPTSNMKLASGIAPVYDMINAGVAIGLGTDGAASTNILNILSEMKLAILLQRIAQKEPEALVAYTALEMATVRGAQAIHKADQIGSLEPGKKADLITISLNRLHQIPVYDPISALVYATYPSEVQTVIINGTIRLLDGHLMYQDHMLQELRTVISRYEQNIQGLRSL